jgi:3-oxoacyl-[acyl-carrier-protein] synthase-1
MKGVYIIADHMLSALGTDSAAHYERLCSGETGIRTYDKWEDLSGPFCLAAVPDDQLEAACTRYHIPASYTRFERFLLLSMQAVIQESGIDPSSPDTVTILSSTKGNIDLINPATAERFPNARINLSETAHTVQSHFGLLQPPVIVSNACISGVMALLMGARLIRSGQYRHAIVSGADVISDFILTGFESLKAVSPEPCRPYDADRQGISLGEGCGTVVLSADKHPGSIAILGGSISNDANHISGPSRTGSGLQQAVRQALSASGNPRIDYINAHGTATAYNDDMEAEAFHALGMQSIPLNSFKGYWGHTLGAAGMLETIAACWSMRRHKLFSSAGYANNGVSRPLNIITQTQDADIRTCLKTASGFGGCNGALVLQKEEDYAGHRAL